jgi:N,N-dimethylformamidase
LARLSSGEPVDQVAPEAVAAAWDFSRNPEGDTALDLSRNRVDGTIVNRPTRAVTGFNWDGHELDFRRAPDQYGAIHFHDDDLDDCGWQPDLCFHVPETLASGIYAARLTSDDLEDYLPFVVRPQLGAPGASVAFLVPTMTYLAYANERILAAAPVLEALGAAGSETMKPDNADFYLQAHPELGISIYDVHSDGSAACYSSYLRPIPNMRPKYRFWCTGGPERFSADLYVVHWLESTGHAYDVVTDHDLHEDGFELLAPYSVVVTGTHPEYWTTSMIDALDAYLIQGGRLMNLGGNGYYWVTSVDSNRRVIEVRRGINGTRTWESAPGECYHSTTGEPGGLWRYRGRSPNSLVGVGFTAQAGVPGPAPGYKRLADSFDERAAFIFAGVGDNEVIGDFGLIGGGAAGYEIDRYDPDAGTPAHALWLATSQGAHDDRYLLVVEDVLFTEQGLDGTTNEKVRADLAYLEYPSDGAVFSVGSCNWCASLSHNGYNNNVARVTTNVLNEFISRPALARSPC